MKRAVMLSLLLVLMLMASGCSSPYISERAPDSGPPPTLTATQEPSPGASPTPSPEITVALDYFGTKNTLAKVQLVVLVKDEERTLAQQAIPPEGVPGFDMAYSQVKDIKADRDPVIYRGLVNSSLTLYIAAYDVSSAPILKSNLEAAAKYFSMPGLAALKDAIPEKKLIGYYWHTWTESSNWGIGAHNDEGEGDLRVWLRVWSDQIIEPVVLPPQEIRYTMPPGSLVGSVAKYSRALNAGDRVEGTVQLTGQYYSTDWSYKWAFEVLGPGGESLSEWMGHWVDNYRHEFSFTASYSGTYTIKVKHASTYNKDLTIKIWPPGWVYSK